MKIRHITTLAERRKRREGMHVKGFTDRPRLSVFRSNKYTYLQIIDDAAGKTLVSASETELKERKGTKTERAVAVAILLAEKAKKANVMAVVFDRGSYRYHGRVKAIAEAVRTAGIQV